MENLNQLLSILGEDSSIECIESTFSKIADILLFKSYIKTEYADYRILEIEFYFKNKNHKDDVTISRTDDEGMWWLHDWGVDISLKSDGKNYYGGILIRSIIPFDDKNAQLYEEKVICGPRNCCWELFYSSALKHNMAPLIITNNEDCSYPGEMGRTKRYITGKTNRIDSDYRFYVKGLKLNIDPNYKASPWK
ncbi:MAG: hypothetical protein J5542_05085 [Bacteroidales bacterium]|nr:hypothetical protein [Bacteroidales bacterium]